MPLLTGGLQLNPSIYMESRVRWHIDWLALLRSLSRLEKPMLL